MKIAIDVMNGDNSPSSNVNGAIRYLIKNPNDKIFLVGKKSTLNQTKKFLHQRKFLIMNSFMLNKKYQIMIQ